MYEISLVSDEETSGYGFMYPAHKPLPADPLARQMIDSLSMETGLSPHRRNEARRIERINMVSQIERLVPEDDSGTTCRAYVVQVVRGKATEFECSIKFTGDGVAKDSAHEELKKSREWANYHSGLRKCAINMRAKLHELYPKLVPKKWEGWESGDIVCTCSCDWHLRSAQDDTIFWPDWCVHTAALMYKMAYKVDMFPMFILTLQDFVVPSLDLQHGKLEATRLQEEEEKKRKRKHCVDLHSDSDDEAPDDCMQCSSWVHCNGHSFPNMAAATRSKSRATGCLGDPVELE